MVESIVEVDTWIGEIVEEIDRLGIAENTIVVVMGDNGPFMQYVRTSGQCDRIYRGGKGEHLVGGIRVNAFLRWKGVLVFGLVLGACAAGAPAARRGQLPPLLWVSRDMDSRSY